MVIWAFDLKDLAKCLVVKRVETFYLGWSMNLQVRAMRQYGLIDLGVNLKFTTWRDESVPEKRVKALEGMRSLGASKGNVWIGGGIGGNEGAQILGTCQKGISK